MNYLVMLRELVLTISAGTGAVVAICGLNTWRSQLKGGAHFETARRLMLAVYRVRDALQSVREPFMSSGEQEEALRVRSDDQRATSETDRSASGFRAAYTARWQRFAAAKSEYDLELLAAEVLWASELKAASGKLEAVVRELYAALFSYLEFRGHLADSGIGAVEFNRIRKLVFRQPEGDRFSEDLIDAVSGFEEILRSKMEL